MERFKARAYTDLLVPILFRYEKNNESYVKLRQEHDSREKRSSSMFRAVEKAKHELRTVETKFIKFQNNCYHLV